jgi:hypothetical protein
MIKKPFVGQKVRFNDLGLKQCFGSAFGKSFMKQKVMILTKVDNESMTEPEETFIVEVDDPEINMLMIDNWCFDAVFTGDNKNRVEVF